MEIIKKIIFCLNVFFILGLVGGVECSTVEAEASLGFWVFLVLCLINLAISQTINEY